MKNPYTVTFIARLILTICLCSLFGLMLVLTQYNHPYADDYAIMDAVKVFGFYGYDRIVYNTWGGRFLSIFLGKIEAYENFLLDHYWVHTVYLLLFNAISCVTLFSAINKYLFRFTTKSSGVVLSALCYMAVQTTSLPEVWSAYYWFSSAVSYQPGIILLHFELGLIVVFYHTGKSFIRWISGTFILLLIVLINFNNELSILINGVTLAVIFFIGRDKKLRAFILLAVLLYVGSAYISITAPGNLRRSQFIPRAGFINAISIATGRTFYILWIILKNPLVLVGLTGAFLTGSYYKSSVFVIRIRSLFGNYKFAPWLFGIALIILIFIPIMYVSNGSFPDRANNEMVQFFIILLLCAALLTGSYFNLNINFKKLSLLMSLAFSVTICCNNFFGLLIKSYISGKVHHLVMKEREQVLKNASDSNQKFVTLLSYEKHTDSLINSTFKNERAVIKQVMKQPPAVLYSRDDLNDSAALRDLKNFYKISGLRVIR